MWNCRESANLIEITLVLRREKTHVEIRRYGHAEDIQRTMALLGAGESQWHPYLLSSSATRASEDMLDSLVLDNRP